MKDLEHIEKPFSHLLTTFAAHFIINHYFTQRKMKKNLFAGMAAMIFCSVFTSCSHDTDFAGQAVEQNIRETYERAFTARFGTPSSTQDWGFGPSNVNVRTRAEEAVPTITEVGPTFNATLAAMSDQIAAVYDASNQGFTQFEQYRSWWGSGWNDKFYQINASVKFSYYSDDYLSQTRDILLKEIPEGINNLAKAQSTGYTITTLGGPVTLTPVYHNSSSADKISYYYYPAGSKPSVEEIKKMPKYTIGFMADPEVCKIADENDASHQTFYHNTYSLVYVDKNGNASYNFPKDYEINFIITNWDLANNRDLTIYDSMGQNEINTKALPNYPEFYGDGDLNVAIHTSGIDQWNLPNSFFDNGITEPKTPHAAVFSIGEKNYVGFEDWTDFDFNDVIFEVTGTEGGEELPDVDVWEEIRVIAEDLSVGQETDFDFNDIVFDVRRYTQTTKKHMDGEVEIILRAAGGTLPLYVDGHEVHELFDVDVNVMVNTNAQKKGLRGADRGPVTIPIPSTNYSGTTIGEIANSIEVYVIKEGKNCYLTAPVGDIASKIGVKCDFEWCAEREDIDNKYKLEGASESLFKDWVQGILPANAWYRLAKESIEEYKKTLIK